MRYNENEFGKKVLMIPDCQVKPGIDLSYLEAIGKYIVNKRPDVIVNIGDFWDFESLSSYDRGKRSFEGRRVKADIEAGVEGMNLLLEPLRNLQMKQQRTKKKVYSPRMIFTAGNHEERYDRFVEENSEFEGLLGTETLNIDQWGWEVYPFLQPVNVEGIHFVHYLANPFSGRPYGGSALNQLNHVSTSFCVGHKQTLDVAIKPTLDGRMNLGIIAGASYPFYEDYKGPQGQNHFRGVVLLNEVKNGFGLPTFVSTDYLMKRYL